jgi:symplekin
MALSAGSGTVTRVLEMMKTLDEPTTRKNKSGFVRMAASSGSRDSWTTILARLATRSSAGLEDVAVKGENDEDLWTHSLGNSIRDVLFNYVMEDFRRNIDVAVSWLSEEWYNDKLLQKAGGDAALHYEKCTLRLIDGFLPYLHPQDKVLTRFLSEIPELNSAILSRVKQMCRDPSVVQLALTSLLYLVMMRPPIKETALDTVQDIWTECKFSFVLLCIALNLNGPLTDHAVDEDARPMAAKYLSKYRPAFLAAATQEGSGSNSAAATAPVTAIST